MNTSLAGFAADDPARGRRFRVNAVDDDGAGFELEYWYRPGVGPDATGHVHESWTETFEILDGSAKYRVGSTVKAASPGETIVFPAGVPHVHPWNVGDVELHVRQSSALSPASRVAIEDTLAGFATMYRLSREGKASSRTGLPNPLQLAVILRRFQRHGNYIEGIPKFAQKILFGALGVVGAWAGYRIDR